MNREIVQKARVATIGRLLTRAREYKACTWECKVPLYHLPNKFSLPFQIPAITYWLNEIRTIVITE